jgi:hypothetical protein
MAVPNTPDILGLGAIVSLLPIGFLLRLAFWLGIVVLLPHRLHPNDSTCPRTGH